MDKKDYRDLFKKFFVEMQIDNMGEKDFANFMKFANRDLTPESRFLVVELAIKLIKIN